MRIAPSPRPIVALVALVALAALWGCGAAPTAAPPSAPTAEGAPSGAPAASAEPAPIAPIAPSAGPRAQSSGSSAAAASAPAGPEVLARDSSPPGIRRLSPEESKELETTCKPLADAMVQAAKKAKPKNATDRNAFMEEFLANPPKLGKVDTARCAGLMLDELKGFLAHTIESEASMSIGQIVIGLSMSLEAEPPALCPSAGPVPADLAALAAAPYASKADDWSARGWKCVRFDLTGQPQRFQYRFVTDDKAGRWEVVARGYSVKGGAPTELYARGRIEDGHIRPSREVYRRAVGK